MLKLNLLVGLLLSWWINACGQSGSADTTFRYENRFDWFDSKIGGLSNTNLINGPAYAIPFNSRESHPFFLTREATLGSLICDNQFYNKVNLFYDIVSDIVVLKISRANGFSALVSLDPSRVTSFQVNNHQFRKLDVAKSSPFGNGFFEILFEGNEVSLLSKRLKSNKIDALSKKLEFDEDNFYYFLYHGKLLPCNLTSAIQLYEKYQLRTFLRQNKIRFRGQNESSLIKITQFLNQKKGAS